jgi:hypothetical protein
MCMSDDDALRALPRDTPDYHARQAAHLRVLAQTARPAGLKARLLEEADRHEQLADEELEALNAPLL